MLKRLMKRMISLALRERDIKAFCISKTFAFNLHRRPLFIGDVCLGDQAKKELLELISNGKNWLHLMLGEKAWKLFTENVLQNVLSVPAITWAQSNTFLQVVMSCMSDCRSLRGHLRWCKLDVIARCHKMMSLMMSRAFITRNTLWSILWRSFPLDSLLGQNMHKASAYFIP